MTPRHIFGLIIATLLTLALYWFWEEGLSMVQRQLRPYPALRASWAEFGPLIMLLAACLLLGAAQWVWDKLPAKQHD